MITPRNLQSLAMAATLSLCLASTVQASEAVTGGYIRGNTKDAAVLKAARFALKQQSAQSGQPLTLQQIMQAQTQVVAGVNYRLCMKVRQGQPAKSITVMATVYQNLSQEWQLTQWDVVKNCAAAGAEASATGSTGI
ncbi:MAG: Aspartic acid proteinase inhibitor [Pseudomonadota bacterium]|jgi:hypothetical protein